MKNIKTQKGITLVALIITIVVLLILAAVTVSSIKNDGIIEKAEGAASNYKGEQVEENGILNSYFDYLNGDSIGGETHIHNYSQKIISPTCIEQGYTLYTCSCGQSYKDNYTEINETNGHVDIRDENGNSGWDYLCDYCGTYLWKPYPYPS